MRQWHLLDAWASSAGPFLLLMREKSGDRVANARFSVVLEVQEDDAAQVVRVPDGLQLSSDDVQQIMDELWRNGVRPRDGAGSLAHVDAQRAHLEDMRRLVFDDKVKP